MKKVKIGFREQSTTIVAEVSVEYTGEEVDNVSALNETEELMKTALNKAQLMKFQKSNRG